METSGELKGAITPRLRSEVSSGRLHIWIESATIEFSDAEALSTALARLVEGTDDVLVDLSAVRYCDEAGFEAVLTSVTHAQGITRFTGLCPGIRSLFSLSHLDRLIED